MKILAWYTFILIILIVIGVAFSENTIKNKLLEVLILTPPVIFILKYLGFI